MPALAKPIPIRPVPVAKRDDDYISRQTLIAALSQSSADLARLLTKDDARDKLPRRILTMAGVSSAKNPALDVFDSIVNSIMNGTDMSTDFPTLSRLIHAQEQRAEVINQLLLANDFKRLNMATRARDKLEESLFAAALNSDDSLLPAERVVLLDRLDSIVAATRKRISAESTTVNDITALLEKIDYKTTELNEAGLKKKFDGTSVQGRELVRKLALATAKRLAEAAKGAEETAA